MIIDSVVPPKVLNYRIYYEQNITKIKYFCTTVQTELVYRK